MSKVCTGAPCRTAATPPTTMKRTSGAERSASAAIDLTAGIPFGNLDDVVHPIFEEPEGVEQS